MLRSNAFKYFVEMYRDELIEFPHLYNIISKNESFINQIMSAYNQIETIVQEGFSGDEVMEIVDFIDGTPYFEVTRLPAKRIRIKCRITPDTYRTAEFFPF